MPLKYCFEIPIIREIRFFCFRKFLKPGIHKDINKITCGFIVNIYLISKKINELKHRILL